MSETIQQRTGPSEGQTIKFESATSPPLDADCDPPIHHLPPEILVEVVRHYVQRDTNIRDLIRLTLVCKRWSDIIQDAPSLWTTINAAEGPSAVRKAMQTAKSGLLDLTFNFSTAQMDQGAFLKSIGEQSARWRSLVVVVHRPTWDAIFEELQKGTPLNLEALYLTSLSMAELRSGAVSVVRGTWALPRLKSIFLSNIPINLASLQLSGLRSLTIECTPVVSGTDIIDVIRESPAIESICLELLDPLTGIPPLHEAFSHPAGNPSIQLAYCHASARDSEHQLRALNRIGCPTLTRRPASTTFNPSETNNRRPSSWGAYQIAIGGLYLRFRVEDVPLDAVEETWDWVFNHLGKPSKALPAHLYLDDWAPEIPAVLEWLTQRLTVTKLSIQTDPYSGGAALDPIIPLFSRPTTSTPATWLFPQAEILETNLVQRNGNDELVEMVMSRHSAAEGKDEVAAPKPFREIWLAFGEFSLATPDPMNMEFLRKVQTVASDADVYWEGNKLE